MKRLVNRQTALAAGLVLVFGAGLALMLSWRYGDLLGRWAYLGFALCAVSAISFTVLTMTKAHEVSETTDEVSETSDEPATSP